MNLVGNGNFKKRENFLVWILGNQIITAEKRFN